MNVETRIKLDKFVIREYQKPLWHAFENKGYRKFISNSSRRSGKDFSAFNLVIRQMLKRVGLYWYLFPTFSQGRRALWEGKTNEGVPFLSYIPEELIEKKREQDMYIRLINGSVLQVLGAESYDRLVGANPIGCVFSEYAVSTDYPKARQLILPMLRSNQGFEIYLSSPRGRNHFWELWNVAQANPKEWYSERLSVRETNHISLEDIERDIEKGEISADLAAQEYFCFPAGQSVLTDISAKAIEDIRVNDLVVSHTGRPRKVLNTMSREYDGDLVVIKSFGSPEEIVCTPNHPVRTYDTNTQTYTWKNAEDITEEDYLVFPKMNLATKKPLISKELCMLIAWYICEGSTFKNGINFAVGKPEEIERVCSLLSSLGYESEVYSHPQSLGKNIIAYSTQLGDFLKTHCGTESNNKRIDFGLISGHEHDFFDELMLGDGCLSVSEKGTKHVYSTVSKTLAYQVQLLANSLHRNYSAGISERDAGEGMIRGRVVNHQKSYQISIYHVSLDSRKTRKSWLKRAKNCIAARIKSISTRKFQGTVYNFSVQYDESYLVAGRAVHNCSFDMGISGSVYGHYVDKMRLENRIGFVPYEEGLPVHVSFDYGMADPSVYLFFQVAGNVIRIIDYYEATRMPIAHYARYLQDKPYVYGKIFPPHDIMVEEGTSGMTRMERFKELGVDLQTPTFLTLDDGIETVRATLPRIWIDEQKCKPLIRALENYSYEFDEKRNVYSSKPKHDSFSHSCDSLRYFCTNMHRLSADTSPSQLQERYNKSRQGHSLPWMFDDRFSR